MKRSKFIALALPILLASCDEEVTAKEAAIRQEVNKRTETFREEMKSDQDRRFTIRVLALSLLAGGSLIGLYRLGGNSRWFSSTEWQAANPLSGDPQPDRPPAGRRVIEAPGSFQSRHRNP